MSVCVMCGGQKVGEKNFPEISRLFQSHKLTFPWVITTKSKRNDDFHQGRLLDTTVIPHQLQ